MIIRLFDIENGVVIPTIHCTTLNTLKLVKDTYPDNHMKIYQYLFYMTCPDPDLNPFFNFPEDSKEESILKEVKADFSSEEPIILDALVFCKKMYETATFRAYRGIKAMLDKLGIYMETTTITGGKDGNGPFLLSAAKQFQDVRESFKGVYKDLMEEQKSTTRGNGYKAYDQ